MPPVRRSRRRETKFTVPYHRFLGSGTDLHKLRYTPSLNKLDQAAKTHDLNYEDPKISTADADEQFHKGSEGTGILGTLRRTTLRLKHSLGLDDHFRKLTPVDNTSTDTELLNRQIMGDQAASAAEDAESGSNGWKGTNVGGHLPPESGNEIRSYVIKRTFKNMIKTTNMNDVNGHFTKYESSLASGVQNVGHYAWAQPEPGDYIVPYFLSTWVTNNKWEAILNTATSYRVKSIGVTIDNIICGEWLTKNNEKVFVPNPQPYFDIFVDHGNYIGYGNLEGISTVPNNEFREIQPIVGTTAELPKYKYNYTAPIHLINYRTLQQ